MTVAARNSETEIVLDFMVRLGQAYLACGEQTAKVELTLRRMAAAYGMRRSRVVTFPTAIFVSLYDDAGERMTLHEGPTETLRLDQIADVYRLGELAQRGEVAPADGLKQLAEILRKQARFGIAGTIVGNTVLAVGVAMILTATPNNLAAAAVLGLVVGMLKALNRNQAVLAVPLPVVASTLVSALVFLGLQHGLAIDPLNALVPPLVTFLPGAMLTLGMVELVYGDMISGASRIMTGLVQLVLLVFGLIAGAVLAGYSPDDLVSAPDGTAPARWIPWAGVVVFGLGAYWHFSAPRRSFWWMLAVLLLAFGAQQFFAGVFGNEISGFFGMLVATPLGYLIQLKFGGPPAMVTFLPTFWLLVPGALSLMSLKRILSDRAAGLDGLITVTFVFASIALGTLMGASLYKWFTERFGWWQLQIGRAGSYFRRKRKN